MTEQGNEMRVFLARKTVDINAHMEEVRNRVVEDAIDRIALAHYRIVLESALEVLEESLAARIKRAGDKVSSGSRKISQAFFHPVAMSRALLRKTRDKRRMKRERNRR